MATQVLVAHSGQRLQTDSRQFATVDDLKDWVSQRIAVPSQNLIVLTNSGRAAKTQSLQTEKDLYVYDIRISHGKQPGITSSLIRETPLPDPLAIPNAPDSIDQVRNVSAWQGLFRERRNWALALAEEAARMAGVTQQRYSEMDAIIRCLDVAVVNVELSIKQIEPRYAELKKWLEPAIQENEQLAANTEHNLALARKVPIAPQMVRFMTNEDIGQQQDEATLESLINMETTRKATKLAPVALQRLVAKANELFLSRDNMVAVFEKLVERFEGVTGRSALAHSEEASTLVRDIEAIANKMDTDYAATLQYKTSSDIPQASRTAETHTEKLIPFLKTRIREMDDMLRYATQARNEVLADSVDLMKAVADITTLHSTVRSQVAAFNSTSEDLATFDYLRLIQQVPYLYASFVAEAVRRREWSDKVKTDSSTLANEMAMFQDEELKRRRKWQKTVGSMYGSELETNVVGLEVNVLGDEKQWPEMTKHDLEVFVDMLQHQGADAVILDDVRKLLMELLSPTKKQLKRIKAFKNGSMHEAALGRSGLLIRGDDDLVRSLQDDKSRLEDRLKTAESRVRRLEDLLHREQAAKQSAEQTARHGIAGLLYSPGHQQGLDQNSITSVRSAKAQDERRQSLQETTAQLMQRIAQLEGQLRDEKQRAADFEQDLKARTNQHDTIRGQMEEVNSTKRDLLGNMEALKREFMEERRSLEDEIRGLRTRLEEVDDEMEHFGESRENEKAAYDDKVRNLEDHISQMLREHGDDSLRMQGQIDFLRNESRLQREQLDAAGKELQSARDEMHSLCKILETAEETADIQLRTLRELHSTMAPMDKAPDDLGDLIESLASRTTELIGKVQVTENDANVLRSNLEQADGLVKELRADMAQAREKSLSEELTVVHLRETIGEEQAKVAALERELEAERSELGALRSKIADGETGSDTLRKELEEGEEKIVGLTQELATRQSQVGSLGEELALLRDKLQGSQARLAALGRHFDARTERAKDLTQRLYSQNDRMYRLLDRLGFNVTRQGSAMTIQRIPKAERSMLQSMNESGHMSSASMRQSVMLGRGLGEGSDLELLHWMKDVDDDDAADTEADRYQAFLGGLGDFDIDCFTETMYKRVKEIEHTARKMQRDARAYRDKAHALQKDAHDKIAYRHFKEGDLALFLPTRNQKSGAWAAFNVGFPHYFLREQDTHRLRSREWLVARISRIQERVVDLSRSMQPASESSSIDDENDNPFQLSDGLRWYLIDAHEDKPGAPTTPGAGKSTVAGSNVEAVADIQTRSAAATGAGAGAGAGTTATRRMLGSRNSMQSIEGVSKTLSRSLESRRSSSASKNGLPLHIATGLAKSGAALATSETNSLRALAPDTPVETSPPTHGAMLPPVAVQNKALASLSKAAADGFEQQQQTQSQTTTNGHGPLGEGTKTPEARGSRLLRRERSATSSSAVDSPSRRSIVWDSLWSLDLSFEGKK